MAQSVMLMTQAGHPFRWRTVNATDNGYPSKIPTATEPAESFGSNAAQATSAAVRNIAPKGRGEGPVQNGIAVLFYGAGSDTNTFSARLVKWVLATEGVANDEVWVPVPLFEVQVALSLQVGIGSRMLASTDRFADTITLTGTTAHASDVRIRSVANDTIACLKVDLEGPQKLEMIFTTGGSATSCNALSHMY